MAINISSGSYLGVHLIYSKSWKLLVATLMGFQKLLHYQFAADLYVLFAAAFGNPLM
jgi:hypothetical protein